MANLEKTIGLRLKVITYVGKDKFEKEKVIYSVRELYKLMEKVNSNNLVYGLSFRDNCIILHLFVDRGAWNGHDEVDNKNKKIEIGGGKG